MSVLTINTDLQAYTLSMLIYKCDGKLLINAEEQHTKIIKSNQNLNNYLIMFIFHVAVFISPSTSSTSICTRPKSKIYNSSHQFDVATFLRSSASNRICCILRYLKASYFVHTRPYWTMLRAKFIQSALILFLTDFFPFISSLPSGVLTNILYNSSHTQQYQIFIPVISVTTLDNYRHIPLLFSHSFTYIISLLAIPFLCQLCNVT
jgi:hypothetical protein